MASAANNHAGILQVVTGGSSNNEAWIATTNQLMLEATATTDSAAGIYGKYIGRPFYAECRINFQQVGTNNAQVAFGLADVFGSALIGNSGTLSITTTGAIIYSPTGGNVWKVQGKNGSTSTDTTTSYTSAGTTATEFHTLGIQGEVVDTLNYRLTYFLDGLQMVDNSSKPLKISHLIPFASAVCMNLGLYAKTATASALTVNLDYMYLSFGRF